MIYISLDTNFLNVSKYKNLEKFELNSEFYEIYDVSKNKECIDKCEVLLPELVYRELLQHEIEAYRKVYNTVEQYAMQLKDFFKFDFHIKFNLFAAWYDLQSIYQSATKFILHQYFINVK